MDNNQDKKIFFIPGWMDVVKNFGYQNGLDIWLGEISSQKSDAKYVIGYSLGADFLLSHHDLCQNADRIILVNPLLDKRNLKGWFWAWLKYVWNEGSQTKTKSLATFLYIIPNLRLTLKLLKLDTPSLLGDIQSDKITVIRGKKDVFFCDDKAANLVRSRNIGLVEIEDVGHNWDRKISEAIKGTIS